MATDVTLVEPGASRFWAAGNEQPEMELSLIELWHSVLKRKWAIAGFAILLALLALAIVLALTPIYRSTASVIIDAKKSRVVQIDEVYGEALAEAKDRFNTQVEILKSQDLATKTITKLKLWDAPEFDPRKQKDGVLQRTLQMVGFRVLNTAPEWNDETLAKAILPAFASHFFIDPVRTSLLVKVSFESADKVLAAKVVNTAVNLYIDNDLDVRFQMTQHASDWLQGRMSGIRAKLDQAERQLQEYRDRAGIVDIKGEAQSGAAKQVDELTQRLVDTRLKRAEAENAYNQIKSMPKDGDLSSVPAVLKNSVVGESIKQLSEAERKLSEISQRYGHEHPKYLQAAGDVKTARENVKKQSEAVVHGVTHDYEVARGTERMLEGALGQAKGTIQSMNRKEFQLGILEREVEANKQIYDLFLKRAKETNVSADLQNPIARIIDGAQVSDAPIKPRRSMIVAMAFLVGLFLASGISIAIDALDTTLKSSADVESKLQQPMLTSLPKLKRKEANRFAVAHVLMNTPNSVYAENVRTARTGVLLSSIDLDHRIIVVTSSLPGEGKTTFATNLAMALAMTKNTLLIDADMRRPTVSLGLELAPQATGLSDFVIGHASASECIVKVPEIPLHVLTSGSPVIQPLELLLSRRFKDGLAELSRQHEVIVIDSPPVELVSDATILAKMATGVIYVVKAEQTPLQSIKNGLQKIRRAEGKMVGIVLNQVDFDRSQRYYGEYSAYRQYGVGYGQREARERPHEAKVA